MTDEQYIDIAIEISKKAKYPYGAIVVKDDEIIGRSDDINLNIYTTRRFNASCKFCIYGYIKNRSYFRNSWTYNKYVVR